MTIKETVNKIKEVGVDKTRVSPIPGSLKFKIEVDTGNGWVTLTGPLARNIADDIVRQATTRVICG